MSTAIRQAPTPLRAAIAYLGAGLSVVPIRPDGSKAPALAWREYQTRLPTEEELRSWLADGLRGVAVVCGRVSGDLEVLDIDDGDLYEPWAALVEEQAPGLLTRLPHVQTPRPGHHIYYRCPALEGSLKLAHRARTDEQGRSTPVTTIESRGEGAYVLAPGSPGPCHPTGRTYRRVSGPSILEVPTIGPEERDVLLAAARALDRWTDPPAPAGNPGVPHEGLRVSDDYDLRGPDWAEILGGWECVRTDGPVRYWRRPGKSGRCWSASTGYCRGPRGEELLRVFSSAAHPLEAGKAYGPYRAYVLLRHGGDYASATRQLAREGYGVPRNGHARPVAGGPATTSPTTSQGREHVTAIQLGPVLLRPGTPRRTPAGKLVLPVTLDRDGQAIDQLLLTSSVSSRRDARRLLTGHLSEVPASEIDGALARLIGAGAVALEATAGADGPTIREVVGQRVPEALRLVYRTDRCLWSETRGGEVHRSDLVAYAPGWLVEAASEAADAPRDAHGRINRPALLRSVRAELEVVWSDLLERLPPADGVALGQDTAAGRAWWSAMVRLWTRTQTFEVARGAGDAGDTVAARASLISRVRSQSRDHLGGHGRPGSRERWREIQRAYAAWWRIYAGEDGELRVLLAMRWELAAQIGVILPGVLDQPSLLALGERYGALWRDPPVTTRMSGAGSRRLAILSREITSQLLEDPTEIVGEDEER